MAEKEYIELSDAIGRIREMASIVGFENPAVAIDCAIRCLERTPAADVAPVVRCKDCKYWRYNRKEEVLDVAVGNDFCSYGKRKDGAK